MEIKTTYIAFDGKEFDDEDLCTEYEGKIRYPALLEQAKFYDRRGNRVAPQYVINDSDLAYFVSLPTEEAVKQYKKLLRLDEVDLEFEEGALRKIAGKAAEKKIGARALRAILEEYMLDIMYEIPKDDMIGRVTITEDYLEGKGAPKIELRGNL